MKPTKHTITALALFLCGSLWAQPWAKYISPGKEDNFFAIQRAFNTYWEETSAERLREENSEKTMNDEERGETPGFEVFKRWEWFWEPRVDAEGNFPSSDHIINEYNKVFAAQQQKSQQVSQLANWQLVGPYLSIPTSGGGMGRVNCIRYKPGNNNEVWIGTPAGGIWKSTNGGSTWDYTTTDNLPVLGVSDIAFNPLRPNTVYIATGDGPAGDTYSVGVLKSTNGGQTWNTTGMTYSLSINRKIDKLIMHPSDTSILFAATSTGLMRTLNGGATWTTVRSGAIRDVEFKPGDPTVVYACNNTTIYKSTNSGASFTASATGLPTTGVGRIELGVTAASNTTVFALLSDASSQGFLGLYRSTDSGATWTLRTNTPNLLGFNANGGDTGGQAFYTLTLCVSQTNANELYVGGVNIWKSTNGGTSFTLNAHWTGGGGRPYVHADIHDIEYVPGTTGGLIVGSDGGVFRSTNNGGAYSDLSAGLAIKQIYRMSNATGSTTELIYGSQDNGTNMRTTGSFDKVIGGDGMDCLIDPTDDNICFGELYYGDLQKSTNAGNSFYSIAPATDGAWVTPFAMAASNHNIMYAGYTEIWKSTDNGENWTQMTTGLNNGTYVDVAISDINPNVVYAIGNGRVYKTTDGGSNWTIINSSLPGSGYTRIMVKPNDPNTAFLTISSFLTTGKVYMTTNGGTTWTNLTKTGLPGVPVNCIVYQNNTPNRVFVGTDLGVYVTDDNLTSWFPFNTGLPNTVITDLDFQYAANLLRASTYGRGVWETDMSSAFITGTNNKPFEQLHVQVLPNPASGRFTVILDNTNGNSQKIELLDLQGKVVFIKTVSNTSHLPVETSQMEDGMYLLRVSDSDNTTVKKLQILH